MNSETICLLIFNLALARALDNNNFLVEQQQVNDLKGIEFSQLSRLSNAEHLKQATKEILIPRIVGTPGHKRVRDYIINSLKDLQWSIEVDSFNDTAPIMGNLEFHNVIATLNPNAERYLVLACHYDSKYFQHMKFLGATDSAVPCAMLLNLAEVLNSHLQPFRESKLSLMLLFFDGEEAFKKWGPSDSTYGSRHLAQKWESQGCLPKIDILMLLDLLGAKEPKFYNLFENTKPWYRLLLDIECRLAGAGLLKDYTKQYFQPTNKRVSRAEDDHLPFLHRNVSILHIIPRPFPFVWHEPYDDEYFINYSVTENLSRIIRIFTMEYLGGLHNENRVSNSNECHKQV